MQRKIFKIQKHIFENSVTIIAAAAAAAAAAAKSLQLCPTLWDPIDRSPPGFPIPGILHARTLEWAAISFSNAWKWKVKVKLLNHVWLLEIPWTAAHRLLHPWDFPGKSSGVGCHCLLQRNTVETGYSLLSTGFDGFHELLCVQQRLSAWISR